MTMQDGTAFGRPFFPGIAFVAGGGVVTPSAAQSAYQTRLAPYRDRWLNPEENTKYYLYAHAWPWSECYVNDDIEPSNPTDNNDSNYDWSALHDIINWCDNNNLKFWIRLDTEGSYPVPGFVDSYPGGGDRPVPAWHRASAQNQMKDFLTAFHKEFAGTSLVIFSFEEDSPGGNPPSDWTLNGWTSGRAEYVRHAYNTLTTMTIILAQSSGVHNHLGDIPVGGMMDDPKPCSGGCGSANSSFPIYDCGQTGIFGYLQSRNGTIQNPPNGVPRATAMNSAANGWKVVDGVCAAHSPWGRTIPIPGEETDQSCGTQGGDYPRNISPSVFIWWASGPPRASAPLNDSGLGQSGPDNGGVIPLMLVAMSCATAQQWDEAFSRFAWGDGQGTNAFPALPYDWLTGGPPLLQIRNDTLSAVDKDAAPFDVAHSTLLANDSGTDLQITGVSDATNCQAVISGSNITVTVAPNYVGTASFRYTASGDEGSGSAFVSIPVQDVTPGTNPAANNDTLNSVSRNSGPITIQANQLLANDTGQSLFVLDVSNAAGCTALLNRCAQTITFQPQTDFVGTATFQYTVGSNEPEWTDTATVSIAVIDTNPAITANNDTLPSVSKNRPGVITINASELLANDVGDNLTVSAVNAITNGGVSVALDVNAQTIQYAPQFGFSGTAQFRYTCTDGTNSANALVSFDVINDPPVIDDPGPFTVVQNELLEFTLTASDANLDNLTFDLETPPEPGDGNINVSSAGVVQYTASVDEPKRVRSISVSVSDGEEKDTVFLDITVTPSDPNHRVVTFDDTDATVGGSWELLSSVAGEGQGYGNEEGTDWFIAGIDAEPTSLHTFTIPASVPIGSVLLATTIVDSAGPPSLEYDDGGWSTVISRRREGVHIQVAEKTVVASDQGKIVLVNKPDGVDNYRYLTALLVLPEGSSSLTSANGSGSGAEIVCPGIDVPEDGAIVFAIGGRLDPNQSQDDHFPSGMTPVLDKWISETVGGQLSIGYSLAGAGSLPNTSIPMDNESEWASTMFAYKLGAGGSGGIQFTGAYQGDCRTHAADSSGDYLDYDVSSVKAKENLTVSLSWPLINESLNLQALVTLTIGTQTYPAVLLDQQSNGGQDVAVFSLADAPGGDIKVRIAVTPDGRALADKVVVDFVEKEVEYTTRTVNFQATAYLQASKSLSFNAAGYVVPVGGSITRRTVEFTAAAYVASSEEPEWVTVFRDADTWVQKIAD